MTLCSILTKVSIVAKSVEAQPPLTRGHKKKSRTRQLLIEAAMQVMGLAGEHQVPDVRKAVGHAYGGGSQFFAMWLVGKDKP